MVTEESVKAEEQNREAAEEQATAKKEDEVGFSALYEQSLQELRSGEIVIGRVVQVSADMVMVDVGSKTEGMIPARELRDAAGNVTVSVGDEIEVLVERRGEDDSLILSRDKAARIKTWGAIKEKFESGQPIQGTITQRVKGGLTVTSGSRRSCPAPRLTSGPSGTSTGSSGRPCSSTS